MDNYDHIPFSGRNRDFKQMLTSVKPHILVMNKMDLSDLRHRNEITRRLKNDGVDKVLYVDCLHGAISGTSYKEILPTVVDLIRNSDRFNRADFTDFNVMVIGIPNVGKSSLINRLRNENMQLSSAAAVGAMAGVTRRVMEKIKINKNPPVYLFDTPGILEPKINWNDQKSLETVMRCALCATMSDLVIGEETIADYLLFWLNKHENFKYVDFLGLDRPSDSITEVLVKGAIHLGQIKMINQLTQLKGAIEKRPDLQNTAVLFLKAFRSGKFGRVLLDDDLL